MRMCRVEAPKNNIEPIQAFDKDFYMSEIKKLEKRAKELEKEIYAKKKKKKVW